METSHDVNEHTDVTVQEARDFLAEKSPGATAVYASAAEDTNSEEPGEEDLERDTEQTPETGSTENSSEDIPEERPWEDESF